MKTEVVIFRLVTATLFPVFLTGLLILLEKKTKFSLLKYGLKQAIIGITFGAFAVLSTEIGVPTGDGVIMNVRDSAPLCAGLIFGAPAGLIAGIIGGLHRWLCVYWGGGMLTRTACSVSTLLAGVFSGIMRQRLFENKKPGFLPAFGIGTTMEVLHMLLILSTNLSDVSYAFTFVQICAFPMIFCNGLAVGLSVLINGRAGERGKLDSKSKYISRDFAFGLLVCVVIAFIVTGSFTQQIVYRITTTDAELYRHVTLYLVAFMEILIYTALFILIYQMLKKKIVKNLQKVNDGLNAITNGDLDTVINVRAYKEFSDLSDDVNATVTSLKHYIKAAEERIDRELEFARQIQHSALPSVFPPYPERPDFNLFASMDAAKEVGGDFYDFYLLDKFTLVILIADVSGKGIPAAMFMMRAKTLIKGLAESGKAIDQIFNEANKKLCENNDSGMFITAWIGKLDLRSGKLEFVNAGHNPPLLKRRNGGFEYLKTKPNFVLAGLDMTNYRTMEATLSAGDRIFLYTDGITEAANEQNELFGEERLKEALNGSANETPEELCKSVKEHVRAFAGNSPQSDDITMLSLFLNATEDTFEMSTIPNAMSHAIVQCFLDDRLKTAEIEEKVQNHMRIAADEIWSNIVNYSKADFATLGLGRDGNTLFMYFSDNGIEFNPIAEKEPDLTLSAEERQIGGLGIHLVKKLSSSINYERRDSKNLLTVGFDLTQS